MRGRKLKPSYLRVLDGNAGHRAINKDEPQPEGDLAEPPGELDARQQAIWRDAIRQCPPGMLKKIDTSVFACWVAAVAVWETARSEVARLGPVVKMGADADGKGGVPVQNPYLSIQNKQAGLIKQFAAELGFSPTARPRVKVSKGNKQKSNTWEGLKSLDD